MKILPSVFHLCFELITKNFFIFRDLRLISGPFFMQYDHLKIEAKWQNHWSENNTFKAEIDKDKEKLYVLDMFPYPSGSGLHVGHPLGYTATDIYCRYKRLQGFNVLHPMGWDAFGLPAEQYAIKTGTHPKMTTEKNVKNFKRQIKMLGFSYDWDREINTTDEKYYKWTQWIFLQLYKKGLAYEAEVPVNWCPELKAVLANEEIVDGKSEIGGHPVVRKPMRQWMFRITEYAESLLEGLDELDWPESVKDLQRNWIGKSEGCEVKFKVKDIDLNITVYTTRPDTLFGATYIVLSPEHPLVREIVAPEKQTEVDDYIKLASTKSDFDRGEINKNKTGVFLGSFAINPVNNAEIPIWIADYVLMSYGTGAIMAVPGHDDRDHEFARKYNLPIVEVVSGGDISKEAYTNSKKGIMVNSSNDNVEFYPGAHIRNLGFESGTFTIRYNFLRKLAGDESAVLVHTLDKNDTKIGDVYTNTDNIYITEDGVIYAANERDYKDNQSTTEQLKIEDLKYQIHEISPSRTEVRLRAKQINSSYIDDFVNIQTPYTIKETDTQIDFLGNSNESLILNITPNNNGFLFSNQMVGGTITIPDVYIVDQIDVAVRSETNVILNPSGEEIETDNLGNVLEISGEHEWDATLHDDAIRVRSWSDGFLQFSSGDFVGTSAIGYHAKWVQREGIAGGNCIKFSDTNEIFRDLVEWPDSAYRKLSLRQEIPNLQGQGVKVGDFVNVRMDVKSSVPNKGSGVD